MTPGGDRSASERELARKERARRRALREGGTEPDAQETGSEGPATDTEPAPVPEPTAPAPASAPAAAQPSRDPQPTAAQPEAPPPPAPEPGPVAREPQRPPRRVPGPDAPMVRLPRPAPRPGETGDVPIGTVRASRSADYQSQPGAAGVPLHRSLRSDGPRRGRRRGSLIALLAILIALAVLVVLVFEPFHGAGSGAVRVTIPAGAGAGEIGDLLAAKGVVAHGVLFSVRARLAGSRDKLRAGPHTLRRGMSYGAALTALTEAPKAAAVLRVVLPEGPSRAEQARRVRAAGVRGDYLAASVRSPQLDFAAYGAPRDTPSLEGFLFPASYELRRTDATAAKLVAQQIAAFKRTLAGVDLAAARRRGLSRYDVLIVASMVEREALVARERPLIAAVIYNRLRRGIPLGIDATLRYRLGNWTKALTKSDLALDSAYNTRTRRGLPPTPIGSPGLASLRAAAKPADAAYLYYVVKPCANGAHAFSTSFARFGRDVAAYERKRRELGRSPIRC